MLTSPSSHPLPEIPGYQLLEKIGEGGMGEIYRALQKTPERTVAVKLLHPLPNGRTPTSPADFLRESELMASLTHPNVVAIFGRGEVEGRSYMVLEFVPGSTLRPLMKPRVPWTVPMAKPLLESIAHALSYIHGRDILHLDLKPENVLYGKDGVIKITDFGLALSRVDAWTLSELGLAQGTLDYCSPEQRYGLPLDQRSDLFSLATLAYELLTGYLPGRVYVPCTQRNAQLPVEINEVLHLGLARDPDERYSTVEMFRRDLMFALAE